MARGFTTNIWFLSAAVFSSVAAGLTFSVRKPSPRSPAGIATCNDEFGKFYRHSRQAWIDFGKTWPDFGRNFEAAIFYGNPIEALPHTRDISDQFNAAMQASPAVHEVGILRKGENPDLNALVEELASDQTDIVIIDQLDAHSGRPLSLDDPRRTLRNYGAYVFGEGDRQKVRVTRDVVPALLLHEIEHFRFIREVMDADVARGSTREQAITAASYDLMMNPGFTARTEHRSVVAEMRATAGRKLDIYQSATLERLVYPHVSGAVAVMRQGMTMGTGPYFDRALQIALSLRRARIRGLERMGASPDEIGRQRDLSTLFGEMVNTSQMDAADIARLEDELDHRLRKLLKQFPRLRP